MRFKFLLFLVFLNSCNNTPPNYKPRSSGNINTVNVVMPKTNWEGNLGKKTRDFLGQIYEGLPIDEPQFSVKYLHPKLNLLLILAS